jgi:hypothetical protein
MTNNRGEGMADLKFQEIFVDAGPTARYGHTHDWQPYKKL